MYLEFYVRISLFFAKLCQHFVAYAIAITSSANTVEAWLQLAISTSQVFQFRSSWKTVTYLILKGMHALNIIFFHLQQG